MSARRFGCTIAFAFLIAHAVPARGDVVYYDFFPLLSLTPVAYLEFRSPPARPNEPWVVTDPADVVDFRLVTGFQGLEGSYTQQLSFDYVVQSDIGQSLDSGGVLGFSADDAASTQILPQYMTTLSAQSATTSVGYHGFWELGTAFSVPEPSTYALLAVAGLAGLGCRRLRAA